MIPRLAETYPNAMVPVCKFTVGSSKTWTFEYRISGPGIADTEVLRNLTENILDILRNEPLAIGTILTLGLVPVIYSLLFRV
jgi:hypothetical protein